MEPGPVLVAGGAGYIGSCTARMLAASGRSVFVLDDLSSGHEAAVPGLPVFRADIANRAAVGAAIDQARPASAMLFAGLISVPDSVRDPRTYYRVNLGGAIALIDELAARGVRNVVFSSSAAVYGVPSAVPIGEDAPLLPINPYGRIKKQIEEALGDMALAGSLRFAALRYFNAAGAEPDASHGEAHEPETHLIPLAVAAGLGRRPPLLIHGLDYPTPDGSCVRDYVHVRDLARAHLAALARIEAGASALTFNLGLGKGWSVLQVVRAVSEAIGHAVPVQTAPRRPGDPPSLVASADRVRAELAWAPEFDLEGTVESAVRWHKQRPRGYR